MTSCTVAVRCLALRGTNEDRVFGDVTRRISTDVQNCAVNSGFCRSGKSKDNAHQQSDDIMDAYCASLVSVDCVLERCKRNLDLHCWRKPQTVASSRETSSDRGEWQASLFRPTLASDVQHIMVRAGTSRVFGGYQACCPIRDHTTRIFINLNLKNS